MKKSFSRFLISLLLLSFASMNVWAQTTTLESGNVYHFRNANVTTVALGAASLTDVNAVTCDTSDKSQQWYVTTDGSNYVLRNMSNGCYLLGSGQSSSWGLSDTSDDGANKFVLTVYGDTAVSLNSTSHTDGYGYMHRDSGNNIVGWSAADNTNSQWVLTTVEYTEDEITANWNEIATVNPDDTAIEAYETALNNLFSDVSCTTPKKSLSADSDFESDTDYQALPATLQAMVKKVYSGDWSEDNEDENKSDWNSEYAKKYRVQLYEPHSEPEASAKILRMYAHTNINNPTGLYVNQRDPLYIMVEGTIAEGASLYLASHTGHGNLGYYTNGVELTEGLNVVPFWNDGNVLYINYIAHTFKEDTDGSWVCDTDNPLSAHSPLKIHIEGGHVNGYFNAAGDDLYEYDSDVDWEYCTARANMVDFTILGRYVTFQFPLLDANTVDNGGGTNKGLSTLFTEYLTGDVFDNTLPNGESGKIHKIIEAWDRIMFAQRMTMGLVNPDSVAKANGIYPRWHTPTEEEIAAGGLEYNADNSLVKGDMYEYPSDYPEYWKYYNHRGLAFGVPSGYMYGSWNHCGYHYNTMESILTQIADESGPTWGPAHEIGHQHQGPINLRGLTEVTNNFFSNVCVWYMGMGTSRVNGTEGSLESVLAAFNTENNDFYTNNIWAQTQMYYRLWLYYHRLGHNVQFWPTLYELCRKDPLDNDYYIDGGESLLKFYKFCCRAAGQDLTEFFRAHGFFEVMESRFVGDYSNAEYTQTQEQIDAAIAEVKALVADGTYKEEDPTVLLINDATGDTGVGHDGATARSNWEGTSTSADYGSYLDFDSGVTAGVTTVTVESDGSITISGDVGLGILIYNEEGELIAFSNNSNFKISADAEHAIATGSATIVAVSTGGETVESTIDTSAAQSVLLESLIADAQLVIDASGDEARAGYFKSSAVTALQSAIDKANEILNNNETGSYSAVYELLYNEYNAVLENEYARISIIPGSKYAIKNRGGGDYMSLDGSNVVTSSTAPEEETLNQWIIEQNGAYRIKNASTSTYLGQVTDANSVNFTVGSDAVDYLITQRDYGWFTFATTNVPGRYMNRHSATQVATWGGADNNSQWSLTLLEADEDNEAKAKLQELVNITNDLIEEVASVSLSVSAEALALQTTTDGSDYYVWTNATNTGGNNEGPIANLVDGDTGNYFHTQWASNGDSDDDLDHYIEVDLGENNKLSAFAFKYTTRASVSNDFPQTIKIYGSNDKQEYLEIETVSSGLPSTGATLYESPAINAGTEYRYLRFMVTTTNTDRVSGGALHNYWHMAEFDIYPVDEVVCTINAGYEETVTTDSVAAAYNETTAAEILLNNAVATETLNTQYSALETAYRNLLTQRNTVLAAELTSAKARLQELIDKTKELIDSVGSVTAGTTTALELTSANLYCNAPYTASNNGDYSEEYVTYLTDGNSSTYLHTDYNSTTATTNGAQHYLRVDLGENNSVGKFGFNYRTRQSGTAHAPTTIVVEGCAEADGDYTVIKELTSSDNGLPATVDTEYTSTVLENAGYRYIRFRVTTTSSGASVTSDSETAYYFVMSEFGVTAVTDAVAEVNGGYANVTAEDILFTYSEYTDATATYTLATTVEQVNTQITDLQSAYDALEEAKNRVVVVDKSELEEAVALLVEKLDVMAVYGAADAGEVELSGKLYCNALYTAGGTSHGDYSSPEADYNLLDTNDDGTANTDTYLHTDYSGTVSAPHYWQVDMGENASARNFQFGYHTRNNGNNCPTTIEVSGSNDNVTFVTFKTYTSADTENPLPTESAEWTSDTIDAGANYRYIRFTVTEAEGGNVFFVISDFSMTLTAATVTARPNSNYSTAYADDVILAAYEKLLEAQAVVANDNATAVEVANMITAVGEETANLQGVIDANVSDRGTLQELMNNVASLIGEVSSTVSDETAVALQCTDSNAAYYLYCNAPGATNNYSGDNSGVAALLDVNEDGTANTGTFLHTTYYGNSHDDELDHYLRLDMGERNAMVSFKFNYVGRVDNTANAPKTILIEGSNDCEEFETITTLTGLPSTDNATYTSDEISNGKAYRYIRFMVTETQNGSAYDGHVFFALSSFGVTSCEMISLNNDVVLSELSLGLLTETYNKNYEAGEICARYYVTESDYNTILQSLQSAYDDLNDANTASDNVYNEKKDALTALINETSTLLETVAGATKVKSDTEYTLQRDDSNAAYYISTNAGQNSADGNSDGTDDGAGIAGLLDDDAATYFHSRWSGTAISEAHYLQVDLGDGNSITDFVFEYCTRQASSANYTSPAPTTIEVRAGNDISTLGDSDPVATFTKDSDGLPAYSDLGTSWTSAVLSAGEASRYLRFTVTASQGPCSSQWNSRYFFAMGGFNLYPAVAADGYTLDSEYANSVNLTQTVVDDTYNEIVDATAVIGNTDAVYTDYETAFTELQAVKETLEKAIAYKELPVLLTTDTEAPVLYNILINRSFFSTTVLQYDSENKVEMADLTTGNRTQGWYFMQGSDGTVKVYSYGRQHEGTPMLLSPIEYSEGTDKVNIVEETSAAGGTEWSISPIDGSEWYNISILNDETTYYLSNHSGSGQKIGFYNSNNTTDGGSMFKFVSADYSKSDSYYQLFNLHAEIGGEVAGGTNPGCYEQTKADDLNSAYAAATTTLADADATDDDYTSAYETLSTAYANLGDIIQPAVGKYYMIKSAHTGYAAGSYIYADNVNGVYWATGKTAADASAVWSVESGSADNTYRLRNLHTNSCFKSVGWGSHATLSEDESLVDVTFTSLGDTQWNITGGNKFHAQETGSKLVGWNGGTGSASAWYLEEVSLDALSYSSSMSAGQSWGTLCLNYPVEVPEGITAHIVSEINDGYVSLTEISSGDVIPAGEAVILYRENSESEAAFTYSYTGSECSLSTDGNLLLGSYYTKAIACDSDKNYYMLMSGDDSEALYWVYEEYSSDGSIADGNADSDNGGYILCNANRGYLPLSDLGSSSIVAYGLRLSGTTAVEEYPVGSEQHTIYDLSGRRLDEVTSPGIYIVNGKKIIVK